jgi:hypothetical protein
MLLLIVEPLIYTYGALDKSEEVIEKVVAQETPHKNTMEGDFNF